MFAKEYAKALYELALSSNAIDEINETKINGYDLKRRSKTLVK